MEVEILFFTAIVVAVFLNRWGGTARRRLQPTKLAPPKHKKRRTDKTVRRLQPRSIKQPQSTSGYRDGDHLTRTNGIDHAEPPPFPISMILEGPAHVIDGDTIRVKKIKIRLAGIDAPELDRPWGQKSKWEMVRICKGHNIRVELTGDTSYDRLVGTCYLPDGTDIGAEIVRAGLALDGGYYSEGKYRHLESAGVRGKIRPFGNKSGPRS